MFSNCLFEALKAKIKNPKTVHIHKIPAKFNSVPQLFPHFWWEDGSKAYDFVANRELKRYTLEIALFSGHIDCVDLDIYKAYIRRKFSRYVERLENAYGKVRTTATEHSAQEQIEMLSWKNAKTNKPDFDEVFEDTKITIAYIENKEIKIQAVSTEDYKKYNVLYWKWDDVLINKIAEENQDLL